MELYLLKRYHLFCCATLLLKDIGDIMSVCARCVVLVNPVFSEFWLFQRENVFDVVSLLCNGLNSMYIIVTEIS
jgi:hypothetical protein